jgi:hypothetical protein
MVKAREKRFCSHQLELIFELVEGFDHPCPSHHRCPLRASQLLDCQNSPPSEVSRLNHLCHSSHLQSKPSDRGRQLNCCFLCYFYCHRLARSRHSAFQSRKFRNFAPPWVVCVRQ